VLRMQLVAIQSSRDGTVLCVNLFVGRHEYRRCGVLLSGEIRIKLCVVTKSAARHCLRWQ
jgi:hypothetical protein